MATKIIHKKSSTPSSVPAAGDLEPGELALNLADQKIYSKTTGGTVVEMGGGTPSAADLLTSIKTVDGSGSGLDSDLLDGQQGSYYLNTATTFGGDVSGTYNAIVVADDSHNHIIANVDGLQTALDGKSATSHNHTLDGLSNTTITSNTSGEILKWNGSAWVNNTLAEAGIQPTGSYLTGNQTITLSGDATGSGTTSIVVTVADDSHNHIISNVDGLQTALDAKLNLSGGTVTGNISVTGTVDGRDVAADGTKLDGIEAGATADQTAAEILTAIKTVDGSGSGLDADLLDGQQGSYYLAASGKAADSNLLDGIDSSSFLRSDVSDQYYRISQSGHGNPTNNLGDPSVTEMALFQEQFDNKTAFYTIANLKFYTSTDGTTWTEYTAFSDTNKRKFLGGDYSSGINIPYNTPHFRIEVTNNGSYVYLNALYMYWSGSGNSTTVKIRKQRGDGVWSQHTNSSVAVGSWPGHLYLPFSTIPFHPSTTSTGHYRTVQIDFQPTWSTTYTNNIGLYRMQLWGGYPAGKRTHYTVDENKQTIFPSEVYANNSTSNKVFHDGYHPNADKLTTARNIALTGAVTGNANFDGTGNISIATTATADPTLTINGDASGSATFTNLGNATLTLTVADDSHDHTWLNKTANPATGPDNALEYINLYGSTSDAPTTDWWNVIRMGHGDPNTYYNNTLAMKMTGSGTGGLWGRTRTNGTAGSWFRYFDDNYHPNADKWTTARTLSLSGDASGNVSWDGSANATLSVTVADDSHNHVISNVDGLQTALDGKLSTSGDTMTGRLILPDGGYSIGNEYHTWKRSYSVNNTSPAELLYHDGNSLPNGGAYRFHAHIDGTGTDQSATAVYWNQNGTWKVNVTYQSGTSSNHPEFIIGGSPEVPQIHIDHTSNYTIQVLAERIELSEDTGTDNLAGFGADAFLGSVGGTLRYNDAGSENNYANGNAVFHDGYHPNADKWTTARTLSLTGDVTGSVNIDGSANVSITATVADDSHNHIISNVDGLQTALDGKSATNHNHTLDSLSNTTITSNTSGEILKWNGSAWVNNTLAEAGIQPAGSYLTGNQTITLSGDLTGSGTTSINAQLAANVVGASELNVTGNGTTSQYLRSDGDGSFTWATPTDTNTTYSAGSGIGLSGTTFSVAAGTGLSQDTSGLSLSATMSPAVATELSNAVNLNDLLGGQAGFYYQTANADTTGNNYPSNEAGSLIVQKSAGNATQLYQTYNTDAKLFARSNYNAGWGSWQRVFADNYHPNADKLTTARNIALTGDVTGSANFDGSANISITATVADDSHNHIISNVDGLQTALDAKLNLSGGTVTGTLNAATFNATSTTNGGFQGIDADTATSPSFTWSADLNTGIYRPAADTLSVTTAGAQRFTVGPAGQIGVGGANYGTSGQVLTSNGTGSAPSWQDAGQIYDSQTFTSSGTWTKPAGVDPNQWALIYLWGGGGAGGSDSSSAGEASGGGGGCGLFFFRRVGDLGSTEAVVVGAGGVANGGDGGNSSFNGITAYGGGGGTGNFGTKPHGGSPFAKEDNDWTELVFSGGRGGGEGSGGSPNYSAENSLYGGGGGAKSGSSSSGGASIFGGNGGNGASSGVSPSDGEVRGGGGAGGYAVTGGNGGRGEVQIYILL